MTGPPLGVLTIGEIRSDPGLPAWLRDQLPRVLAVETFAGPEIPIHDRWRDPDSGRLDSNLVIDALVDALVPDLHGIDGSQEARLLAITDADLYAPRRDFVFGEATLGGPCALISLARLEHPDSQIFRRRALKEAVHEIGHLAGRAHCPDPACVMSPSADILEIDRKTESFCSACLSGRGSPHPP